MALVDERTSDKHQYRLHTIKTNKFKTISIILQMKKQLTGEDLTKRALLPYVLQSATENLTSSKEIRARLEELYGATLTCDLSKKGENHIITFRLDIAHQRYLFKETGIFEEAARLLSDILFHPKDGKNKTFDEKIVQKEKRSLKQKIEALYDDKMRYANMRLIQEMFENEPYSQHVYGSLEKVDAINGGNLFKYYEQALREDDIDLYVVGDIDPEQVEQAADRFFTFPSDRKNVKRASSVQHKKPQHVKEKIEEQEINQGKLNIGFRTNITFSNEDYSALQVFNGIFGGFSHSKLFINVREKESLAYYASSAIESHIGMMIVMSGIDSNNYEKTVSIIKEQLDKMKNGDFSELEFDQTKIMLKNSILETLDDPRGIVELLYHQVIANVTFTIDEWLQAIDRVTRDEVTRVANKIEMDTIYFLKGEGA
ncbi:peptidase M16 [Pueribacillus theae]|uniref:Peptidase M16 n=1 Tax=Pueribacillus theae TaxID=2171751 RepID=A0A2U1K8H1_9BACI|nr:pitrilysin family protein [Pueribacillus theae]PWA13563.1 peptidase M16 [Pueribacillus theae]